MSNTNQVTLGSRLRDINFGFDRFSGLYIWALFIIIFAIWVPDSFFDLDTAQGLASEKSIIVLLALALMIPLAAGAYDLSIGATTNISAVIVAKLQTDNGWGMWSAIAVAVGAGALIGIINGFVVVKLKVNSFIATLAMASVIASVIIIITGQRQPVPPMDEQWRNLTQFEIFGFQSVALIVLVIALIFWWFMQHTPPGRYLYAVGGNQEAARLSGVKVGMWTWIALIISGTTCGIAGVLYASLIGVSLTFGGALLLPAFAAVFLGSTQFLPGKFNVWGTVLAVLVLATGVKGLQLATGQQWLESMFNGVALVAAVSFAVWRQKQSKVRAREKELEARDSGQKTQGQ
jgi:ribose transport system permease protein